MAVNAAEQIADCGLSELDRCCRLAEKDSPPDLALRAAFGDFAPDVTAWLSDAFRRHVVDGEKVEIALRLDRASRMRARDEALRRAASLLALGSDGAWTVALRLAQAVARHQRKRGTAATPLDDAVAAALASGVSVPETPRQLLNIIR